MMQIQSTGNRALSTAEERLRVAVQSERALRDAAETKTTTAARKPEDVVRSAARSFLMDHPSPDPAEGVVMSLSAQGKERSAQALRQGDDDGRVTKVAEQNQTPQEETKKKVPPPMKEAVAALQERKEDRRAEEETFSQRKEVQPDKADEVTTERVNTNNLGQYNKKELMDFFLRGDLSLKEYKDEIDSRTAQARAAFEEEAA